MDRTGMKGIVELQLRDSSGNTKSLFQPNKLWDAVIRGNLKLIFSRLI